tara:strand:+ start:47 stop:766 length:720 start_codon:yes stop_codon:yes gene_type:complete
MEKAKKIKLYMGLFYALAVSGFLFFFFSKFSYQEIISYEFIKNNRDFFFDLKKSNLFLLITLFFLFTIVWVMAAGFGSPLGLLAGFIFGKWLGILILVFGMTIGATGLYIFANYFLKDLIKEKFSTKFKNLEHKFKKSEFNYLLIYRLVGGIPFAISNVLPCIFNVRVLNFFLTTLIGIIPQLFLIVSIGSGLENIINQNMEAPKIKEIIISPEIYIPLLAFFGLVLITIFTRKIFYNK